MAIAIRYEIKALLLLGLALLSYTADGQNSYGDRRGLTAGGGATVFNVNSYGAKANGKTDNVQAFMKAWNAACKSDSPAKLVIPEGTYLAGQVAFQGPCSSPIIVEVQGTIKAQTDLSEYPSAEWFSFESIDGLELTGGGTFDGQGPEVWKYNDCHGGSNCQLLPHTLTFAKVSNAVIHDINSVNSKSFHMIMSFCQHIAIHNCHLTAPEDSPNTDGLHISTSSFVSVTSSVIGTGDDCISLGQGSTDISISEITCGPGHGISIGSLGKYKNEKDVKGIHVQNCKFSGTTNGVRIKTWPGSMPSAASSITFQDIEMDSVKNPIVIDQCYGSKSSEPSQVKISDVLFKNIWGTTISDVAVNLVCSPSVPCQGVKLVDINLSFNGRLRKDSFFKSSCLFAKVSTSGRQKPPPCHH